MAFLNILPDPDTEMTEAGIDHASGNKGPGFASVSITSNDKVMMNKTNTGRIITRKLATQQWKVKISYNPLTRDEFEPVYNFLLYYGKLRPFFVRLPQYESSRNSSITTGNITIPSEVSAGAQYITAAGFNSTATDAPRPGDMFTVNDSSDSLHQKVYRAIRVETPQTNQHESSINSNTARIWTYPNVLRTISTSATLEFGPKNPKMRVIMDKDVVSYSLNTDNLYKFDLQLTEALA